MSLKPHDDDAGGGPMKILHVIHRFVDTSQRGSEQYTAALCRHLAAKHEVAVLYTSPAVAEGHLERATLGGLTTFVLGAWASWQEAKPERLADGRACVCDRAPRVATRRSPFPASPLPVTASAQDRGASKRSIGVHAPRFLAFVPPDQRPRASPTAILADQPPELCGMLRSVDSPFVLMAAALGLGTPSLLTRKALRAWYLRRRRPRLTACVFRDVDLFVAPCRPFHRGGTPTVEGRGEHSRHRTRGLPTSKPPKTSPCGAALSAQSRRTKGMDVLLEAFETVAGATLTVYGSAPPAYLAGARDRKVRFMGELAEAARAEVFAHMDVLLLPSILFENSSLVTLEAFLFGVPVVASDIGALREIVSGGPAAFWSRWATRETCALRSNAWLRSGESSRGLLPTCRA